MKFIYLIDVSGLAYETVHSLCGYKGKNLKADRMGHFLGLEKEKEDMLHILHSKMGSNLSETKKNSLNLEFIFDCFTGTPARFDMFADYKGNRDANKTAFDSKEMKKVLMRYKEEMNILGCTTVEQAGVEADDIIAHLVDYHTSRGFNVCMVSSDSDLKQLVSSENGVHCIMFDLSKQKAFVDLNFDLGGEEVSEMGNIFGSLGDDEDNFVPTWLENREAINPNNILLQKIVAGDKSDNIPSAIYYTKGVSDMGVSEDRMKKIFAEGKLTAQKGFTYDSIKNDLLFVLNESIKTKKDPEIIFDKDEHKKGFERNSKLIKLDCNILSDSNKKEIVSSVSGDTSAFKNFYILEPFKQENMSWDKYNS